MGFGESGISEINGIESRKAATDADRIASATSYSDIEKENAERDELLKKVEPQDLIKFGMMPVINIKYFFINTYLLDIKLKR